MTSVFIVTGTTSGLGYAFVQEIIRKKGVIYSISRTEKEKISSVVEKHFVCDLSEEKEVEKTIYKVFEEIDFKTVESITLINNAGTILPIGNIGTLKTKDISNSVCTNLLAPILLSEIFIKHTQDINCSKYILNISSGAGKKPYAGWATYCASKAGIDLFTQCVGVEQENKKYPVKIISFAPGVVDTKMQTTIRSTPKEQFNAVTRFIDLKENNQLLSPNFVAKTLLNLLKEGVLENGGCFDVRDFISLKQ